MNIAHAGDDSDDASYKINAYHLYSLTASGSFIIDLTSVQGFNATQNNGYRCDKLDGDAAWCV